VTFQRLKYLSFAHSVIYLLLLGCWLTDGPPSLRFILGMSHGLGWIGMSLLCIFAVRQRTISITLAVTVAVIGGLGPFAGSAGFVIEERAARARTAASKGIGL
jgi:hypothetical protein